MDLRICFVAGYMRTATKVDCNQFSITIRELAQEYPKPRHMHHSCVSALTCHVTKSTEHALEFQIAKNYADRDDPKPIEGYLEDIKRDLEEAGFAMVGSEFIGNASFLPDNENY